MRETGWGEQGAWVVVWQKAGSPYALELLEAWKVKRIESRSDFPEGPTAVFGISATAEAALEKVEMRLKGDPYFKRRYRGGVFKVVPYHLGIAIDKEGNLLVLPSMGKI